ncbi:VOC family protein [Glaciibacter superstes]|uniref:VOC family protein n=1 Tax=Glaciibacter superstes TaxID=501023 RepID=UPI000686F07D|nr:VOC family protein [Glaciibacter superstes]
MTDTTPSTVAAPPVGIGRLDLVVLDCPDPLALAGFYAQVLGWARESDSNDSWATIRPPGDARRTSTGMAFQGAADFVAPTWPDNSVPQQSHLDIDVADLDEAEYAILAAGATKTGLPEPESEEGKRDSFRVYLDPVGHPFCLCRSS